LGLGKRRNGWDIRVDYVRMYDFSHFLIPLVGIYIAVFFPIGEGPAYKNGMGSKDCIDALLALRVQ
jgi:hypothetical protein